jgi:uncharacterized protein
LPSCMRGMFRPTLSRSAVAPLLSNRLIDFSRALRAGRLNVTPTQTIEAARALAHIDIGDRAEVYLALRTALITRPEDFASFDREFNRFWDRALELRARRPGDERLPRPSITKQPESNRGVTSLTDWLRNRPSETDPRSHAVPLVSDHDSNSGEDFRTFHSDELDALRRLAARIARRLRSQRRRRWQTARRGRNLSFRKTLRSGMRTGELVALHFRKRRRQRAKLVVLCDVSGSMDLYARLLLQFVYAMQNSFARVESFLFSTRLARVTQPLAADSYGNALARLAREQHGWSGGTRIGASLAEFNTNWPRLVDGKTIVLILSDGWDTGEPSQLADAIRLLRRRAAKLVWLNPLLGNPGYQPEARGMRAALPYIDVFAPAHDLRSLESLVL